MMPGSRTAVRPPGGALPGERRPSRQPARRTSIPLSKPAFSSAEVRAVARTLRSGHIGGNGPAGRRVERQLAQRLAAPHVLLMTSCTHAFQAGLAALGVGRGDEVILPSFCYMSMANAVLNLGARPVFVDVEPAHLTLDAAQAAQAVTRRTKAVLAVHYAGYPCRMDPLLALGRARGLAIVEDAAQALGTVDQGRPLGTIGDAGCISFHETKNVSCGEGGAFITRRPELAARADVIREKGTNRSAFLRGEVPRYDWVAPGDNFVLSDIQAAILEVQLRRLDGVIARRRRLGQRYLDRLQALAARGRIRLPAIKESAALRYNWHQFYVMVQPPQRRDRVMARLRARGIQAAFHFTALHTSPFGRTLGAPRRLPNAEAAAAQLLRLPLYAGLTLAQHARVVDALYEALA